MLKKARVLDSDDGLTHHRCDLAQGHLDAILVVQGCQGAAIGGQDHGPLGQRWRIEGGGQGFEVLHCALGEHPEATDEGHRNEGSHDPGCHDDPEQHPESP